MKYDVIVIGAGAAGLMAAKEFSEAGYNICMLEAEAVAGGRIATIREPGFNEPVEAGAEFIHGKLKLTLKILKEAGIGFGSIEGDMITVQDGKWLQDHDDNKHWNEFIKQLHKQKKDISIQAFLDIYFAEEKYAMLRDSVQHFAEGFDLADITNASVLFVKEEWSNQEAPQYRTNGGYGKLIAYLEERCKIKNAFIYYNTPVTRIEYNNKDVTVYTATNKSFYASKLIVTASVGVLQTNDIQFEPAPATHISAIHYLGFGAVIKILLQFKHNFWQAYANDIGFILSDETIPTWWTQLPNKTNLLTGWLGGPKASSLSLINDDELLQIALQSLASIFKKRVAELQQQLDHHKIICWHNKPFIKGGYSYNTITSADAKKILAEPINDMIFFAGEAYYDGESQGTVEAALQSGMEAAKKIKHLL